MGPSIEMMSQFIRDKTENKRRVFLGNAGVPPLRSAVALLVGAMRIKALRSRVRPSR